MSLEEITVCIGTEEKTRIPCKVLKYSILSQTKNPIKFIEMEGESWLNLSSRKLGVGTGFSLMRWSIPERLKYEGFAIYLDADQICLTDIQDLWNSNVTKPNASSIYCTYDDDKFMTNAPNTSVMLIDCEKAKKDWWTLDQVVKALELDCPNRKAYIDIMHAKHISPAPVKIPTYWNQLNIAQPDTKLLHYTIESQQPWYNPKHPCQYIWRQYLVDALKDGFIQKTEIEEAIKIFRPATRDKRALGMHPYWGKWIKEFN